MGGEPLAAGLADAYDAGMPRPPKIPPKYWMYGIAVVAPILQYAGKALLEHLRGAPRHCPKCSYQMVSEVGRAVGRRTGEHRPVLHYWRCSACAARYKSSDDGPFRPVPEDEWRRHVRIRFPR